MTVMPCRPLDRPMPETPDPRSVAAPIAATGAYVVRDNSADSGTNTWWSDAVTVGAIGDSVRASVPGVTVTCAVVLTVGACAVRVRLAVVGVTTLWSLTATVGAYPVRVSEAVPGTTVSDAMPFTVGA
jgi:hypothetical protein